MKHAILLLLSILAACMGGPSPADVQADRARYSAVLAVTADNQIDPLEAPVFAQMMLAWDEKLRADEGSAANNMLRDLVRVWGFAAVQVFAVPALQQRFPDVFRLLDLNNDGMLSEQELLAIDPRSPAFAIVTITTLQQLLKKH